MNGFDIIKIQRGQFLTGRKVIAKDLKQNENTIYKRLKILEKLKYINIESNNKYSILTIIKYDSYQQKISKGNSESNKRVTSQQQAGNTNNNGNNEDNIYIPTFEDFWKIYSRKTDKKKSEISWNKIPDCEKPKIIEAVPKYLKSVSDKKFIKYPTTYLNGECWNDEYGTVETNIITLDEFKPKENWEKELEELTKQRGY